MAKINSVSFTTNTTTLLGHVVRPRGLMDWRLAAHAYGTWGSGSLTFQLSSDGGTTKTTLDDGSATVTLTANRWIDIYPPSAPAENGKLLLYATLAGATNPSLTVELYDTE